jgi:hypothetical protein
MSFMCQFAETNSADIKISHVAVFTTTELASTNDTTFVLWWATRAHLD